MNVWKKRDENVSSVCEAVEKHTQMPREYLLNDPRKYSYKGIKEAADLFLKHVARGSHIVVHGDYDTDGVTSLAIFKILFRAMRLKNSSIYAPCRFKDGYGLKDEHIEKYVSEKCDLLITVDNGIAAISAISLAKEKGMDVIVLDHHEPITENGELYLPVADVLVDPHVTTSDFDDLCGAGLSLVFAKEVLSRLSFVTVAQKKEIFHQMKSFAAIGTVGDVVSLKDHNRKIVKRGLDSINKHFCSCGLNVLLEELDLSFVDVETVAFTLSPIINASGRLYEDGATFALNILTATKDSEDLRNCCKELMSRNEERKEKTKIALKEAELKMQSHMDDRVIVLVSSASPGIVGLVAGKLTEEYNRPAIVLTKVGDILKGSGRSTENFNIKSALDECSCYLSSYGGHIAACGLSLKPEDLKEFTEKINSLAPAITDNDVVYYDFEASLDEVKNIIKEQNDLSPFGAGNPKPEILFRDLPIEKVLHMGADQNHLKLPVGTDTSLVWFNHSDVFEAMGSPKKVDVIVSASVNVWRNKVSVQLQVTDLRPA